MESNEIENAEQKSSEELWAGLLEVVNSQLEINSQLKEIIKPIIIEASSKRSDVSLDEETVNKITDLVVDAEASQARERAIFHQLFPTEDIYEEELEQAEINTTTPDDEKS